MDVVDEGNWLRIGPNSRRGEDGEHFQYWCCADGEFWHVTIEMEGAYCTIYVVYKRHAPIHVLSHLLALAPNLTDCDSCRKE